MELAFGGVKSNQTLLSQLFARRYQLETGAAFGLYSGMSKPPFRSPYDRFLRQLKSEGRTNMYGAVPYLMKTFGLNRESAFQVVCDWLDQQAIHDAPGNQRAVAKKAETKRRKTPRRL
jgi:hypothetical protein